MIERITKFFHQEEQEELRICLFNIKDVDQASIEYLQKRLSSLPLIFVPVANGPRLEFVSTGYMARKLRPQEEETAEEEQEEKTIKEEGGKRWEDLK